MVLNSVRSLDGPLRVWRGRKKENQAVSIRKISKTSRLRSQVGGRYCTSWRGRSPSRCRQRSEARSDGGAEKEMITKKLPSPTPVVAVVQVTGYRASGVPGRGVRRFYTRPKVARPPFTGRPGGDHGPCKYDIPRPCNFRTVFGVHWSPPMTRGHRAGRRRPVDRVMVQRPKAPVLFWKRRGLPSVRSLQKPTLP